MSIVLSLVVTAIAVFLFIALVVFKALFEYMPYVCGGLASICIYAGAPETRKKIPGQPMMGFLVILAIIELIAFLLLSVKQINKALVISSTAFLLALIGVVIFEGMEPDSIGFCTVVTMVYFLLSIICLLCNVARYSTNNNDTGNVFSKLANAFLYVVAADSLIAGVGGFLWKPYFEILGGKSYDYFNMAYILVQIIVCFIVVVTYVISERALRANNRS